MCSDFSLNNRADHPISYLDTLMKTGSESIETTSYRKRILFAGFVARMEDTSAEVSDIPRIGGGRGLRGGAGKEWVGCFLDDLRAFRINADQ